MKSGMMGAAAALVLAAVLTGGFNTLAADKVGNGGGLWACQVGQDVASGMLVDLYEAREEFGYPTMQTPETDPNLIADVRFAQLSATWPEFAARVKPHLDDVRARARFVDAILAVVDDSLFRVIPHPRFCMGGTWQYVQFANFTNQDQVLIRKDVWESPNVPALDKAALYWHEAVYKMLRVEAGDKDSVRARQVVGLLFSALPSQQVRAEIEKILKDQGPAPTPTPSPTPAQPQEGWACIFEYRNEGVFYFATGETRMETEFEVQKLCQDKSSDAFFCDKNTIRCDRWTETSHWACTLKNPNTKRVYMAKGRSAIEAEYRVRTDCAKQGDAFFCGKPAQIDCAN